VDTESDDINIARKAVVLGVDPGLTGAVAFLSLRDFTLCGVKDLPFIGKDLSAVGLASLLGERPELHLYHAFVEKSQSFPRQGVASAFRYGTGYGIIQGVLGTLSAPYTLVPPTKWKADLRLSGKDKDASRKLASERWPDHAHLFARKKDDGRAEAALIALYGALQITGARI
jgi:hypothetical protein